MITTNERTPGNTSYKLNMLNQERQVLNRLRKNIGKHQSRPDFTVGSVAVRKVRCFALET